MSVIAAFSLATILFGDQNANVAPDLDRFSGVVGHPATEDLGATGGYLPMTPHFPVEANGRAISASGGASYFSDYYHRVHVNPVRIDLGNLVSTKTVPFQVWNAHLEAHTLNSIGGLEEGILITWQPAPPLLYAALEEKNYQLSVTPDGRPTLDAAFAFNFDTGEAPALIVTANRIIAWGWKPNWAEGIRERLAWATDIMQSESLVEQRRALRQAPRRVLEADFIVAGDERQQLDLALFGWGARVWVIPVWQEMQLLENAAWAGETEVNCITDNLEFHTGGLCIFMGDSARETEVMEIAAVASAGITLKRGIERDWRQGTRLYPARTALISGEPALTRETDTVMTLSASFALQDASDVPEMPPAVLYRGRPVLLTHPNEAETLTREYGRLLATLDSGLSAAAQVSDVGGRALPILSWRWLGDGRAARQAFRSLLYWLSGRQRALWIPTWADDLSIADVMGATDTALDVKWCGYTRFGKASAGRRDVLISLYDGSRLFRRITASAEITPDIERLTLDTAPGIELNPGNVRQICWLACCRGDSDEVDIEHLVDSLGVARAELIFRGVRDDEF